MKDNRIFSVFIFTLIVLNMSFCQSKINENPILGEWEAYKKTDLDGGDGSDVTFDSLPYTVKLELKFLDEGKSYFNNGEGKIETDYSLKDNILKVSRFTYSIVEINGSELVLKEEKFLGKLIYLKKAGD
ncbi:hypothetical protein WIW50_07780 [Flavobacteriaceae bacterium 3-367]|uniref:hypothetical protein n=1 Tax=Eudoraea algarum TaxID=3417568 RepID=UPI00326D164D